MQREEDHKFKASLAPVNKAKRERERRENIVSQRRSNSTSIEKRNESLGLHRNMNIHSSCLQQPKYKGTNRIWHTNTTEYCVVRKRDELETHPTA